MTPFAGAPLVYVAGAYSAPTPEAVQANVDAAIDAGNRLLDAGLRVRVPHLSHYQHARRPREYETWMVLDFADLRECDALLRLPGASSGADREVEVAHFNGRVTMAGIDWLRSEATYALEMVRDARARGLTRPDIEEDILDDARAHVEDALRLWWDQGCRDLTIPVFTDEAACIAWGLAWRR